MSYDRILRHELWNSPRFLSLHTTDARLLFVVLLTEADDYGNLEGHPFRIFRKVRDLIAAKSKEDVSKFLADLVDAELIIGYRVGDKQYFHIPRFQSQRRYRSRKCPQAPFEENPQPTTIQGLREKPAADLPQTCRRPAADLPRGVGVGVGVVVGEPHSGTPVAVGSKPHSDTLTLYVADPSGIADGHETAAPLPAKPKPDRHRFTEDDMALASRICEAAQEVSPSCRPNLKAWANDLRLMRERDGRSLEEIEAMFRWANTDPFWRPNILSITTLRAKWPKLEARRGGSRAAYRPEERAVISAYNNSLPPRGWAEAVDDPYSPERASAITEFLRLSDKPQWIERYFGYLAASLEPRPGCGFDWAIRRETFLRAREGNFARVAA